MPKITITVDIPEFEDIEDEDTLIEGRRGDDPDDYRPVRKKVEGAFLAQMRREAQEHLTAKIKSVVESRTVAVVDEVLAGEFQPVDRFGDRHKKTTLRAMIGIYGMDYLTAEVDDNGRADNYSGRRQPRIHFLIRQITADVFAKELKAEVDKATAEFKRSMAGKVAGEITQTVNRLLGLPTA